MIQSSHPSSLKFTCSAFLLHLDLDFFPCLFPCRLLSAVLLRRRGPSPLFSLFLERVRLRSTSVSDLPRVTRSWKQSWFCSRSERQGEVCKSPGALLNILNSAPTSSSLSERVETSNRYFCLRSGECKRSSARIKEENNCSQIHLGCTVFRGEGGMEGGGGGCAFSHRGLSLPLCFCLVFLRSTLNLHETNYS
uniref:Uncharacterized protein n=1 Tax=Sphaeramia orbicularis TaxID=375764 RepID=A0A672ZN69_9TELE